MQEVKYFLNFILKLLLPTIKPYKRHLNLLEWDTKLLKQSWEATMLVPWRRGTSTWGAPDFGVSGSGFFTHSLQCIRSIYCSTHAAILLPSGLVPGLPPCCCRTPAAMELGQNLCVGRCWDLIFLALGAGSGLLASSMGCRIRRRALMNLLTGIERLGKEKYEWAPLFILPECCASCVVRSRKKYIQKLYFYLSSDWFRIIYLF